MISKTSIRIDLDFTAGTISNCTILLKGPINVNCWDFVKNVLNRCNSPLHLLISAIVVVQCYSMKTFILAQSIELVTYLLVERVSINKF